MFVPFHAFRKRFARVTVRAAGLAVVAALSACGRPESEYPAPIRSSESVKVALLVPHGGNSNDSTVAQSLENAANLAVFDLSYVDVTIDLAVYETAGDASRAAEQAELAVAEGARIIIGPLYAQAANAAGLATADSGVNILTFSNNVDIAGSNVFVLGQTFDSTAERLVRYAMSQGRSRIAVVHANDPAGMVGARAISRAADKFDAMVVGTIGYQLSQQGIVEAMRPASVMIKDSGADTVFLTAGVDADLPFLTQLLPENGITPDLFQYVGLTHWDSRPVLYKNQAIQGGWFAVPDRERYAQFVARYSEAYGGPPHRLAGLAYDGITAVGMLASTGGDLSAEGLARVDGFSGVHGAFRLRVDGTNQRSLAVATVDGDQVIEIDPAPPEFFVGFSF